MLLFTSEVQGPPQRAQFAGGYFQSVHPAFSQLNVAATPWLEVSLGSAPEAYETGDHGFLIQGWCEQNRAALLADSARAFGLVPRFFAALDLPAGLSLPSPHSQVVLCAMPHNQHHVKPQNAKRCPRGHYFSSNHAIVNCAACGGALK